MFFEGDENKREANLRKHGLDPMTGAELFDGRSVFTYPTSRGDEERFVTVGLLADQFVAVVWTERRGRDSPDLNEKGKKCGKKNIS